MSLRLAATGALVVVVAVARATALDLVVAGTGLPKAYSLKYRALDADGRTMGHYALVASGSSASVRMDMGSLWWRVVGDGTRTATLGGVGKDREQSQLLAPGRRPILWSAPVLPLPLLGVPALRGVRETANGTFSAESDLPGVGNGEDPVERPVTGRYALRSGTALLSEVAYLDEGGRPVETWTYRGSRRLGGIFVPETIERTAVSTLRVVGGARWVLEEARSLPKAPVLSVGSLMGAGEWAQASKGSHETSFRYDPKQGTLDHQIDDSLARDAMIEKTTLPSSESYGLVAIALIGGLGIGYAAWRASRKLSPVA